MKKRATVIDTLKKEGLTAVLGAVPPDEALKIAKACCTGGINCIEITFRSEKAPETLEALRENREITLGAGTVLDPETARIAILSGASFIVSPHLDPAICKMCHRYDIPYLAGCQTVTETVNALEEGVDMIKIFPASVLGPAYLKALRGPLPWVEAMPTGGVTVETIPQWIAAGASAIGIGSDLTAPGASGDWTGITERARLYRAALLKARGASNE